jgi:hypothetical protein
MLNIRKLLNSYKGAIAAVKFVLQTDLLAQFSLVAKMEKAKRLQLAGPSPGNQPPLDESDLENREEEEDRDESEPNTAQSDSDNAVASHADRTSPTSNGSS